MKNAKHMPSSVMNSGKAMKHISPRTNPMVTPSKAHGVGASGNPSPKANMPANNVGMHSVPLGSGKSTFGASAASSATKQSAGRAGVVDNIGAHLNSQNYVNTGNKFQLGTTYHKDGEAPAYLKNPKNPTH